MNNKTPWYIWLSAFAFFILWINLSVKALASAEYKHLYTKATFNLVFLWGAFVMFIPISFIVLIDIIFLGNVPEGALHYDILMTAGFILIYLGGVYGAYRHTLWRKKNMPTLSWKL